MKTLLLTIIIASLTLAGFAQVPESNYQKVRKLKTVAEKRAFVLGLGHAEQVTLWQTHFTYILLNETLTAEQRDGMVRLLDAFTAGELTAEHEQEAKDLFPRELGARVFHPGPVEGIGSTCQAKSITREIRETTLNRASGFTFASFASFRGQRTSVADCDCRQLGTNWSCDANGCTGSGGCTPTPDGCSIFYMYPCDGKCSKPGREEEAD